MVINQKIIDALNYRIEQEEMSSRLYKAMGLWLNKKGYTGAGKLWCKYSEEELIHAGWSYTYLQDLNIKPITPKLEQPQVEFKSLPNIIALSMQHEIDITNQCNDLAGLCVKEGDYVTLGLAQQYLKEQVDEIEKISTFIDELEVFGDSEVALRLLDNKMEELANG